MSSKAKKRPRADADDSRADCPFSITMISAPSNDDRDQTAKKRKRNGDDDTSSATPAKREFIQVSPFVPKGKFKSNQSMNLAYTLDPQKRWLEMTRYNSFVCEWPPQAKSHAQRCYRACAVLRAVFPAPRFHLTDGSLQ